MKHNIDLDEILKQALSPENEPDYWLNQKILRQKKENERMNRRLKKRIPATALAMVLTLFVGTATSYAAWKYLTPDKVAEVTGDKTLAGAFQSKDAIEINQIQEYGNYKITLLGIVSGKNLSQFVTKDSNGDIKEDRTYAVTAIENIDGTPRPATSDEKYGEDPFFVSPLIKGQNPFEFNIATMGGGYTEIVQDGIQYRLTECNNIEKFAKQGLYLCVSSSTFYDVNAYKYDTSTGEITRNEAYDGVNALFNLPIDESKADEAEAKAYIQEKKLSDQKNEQEPVDYLISKIGEEVATWSEEELNEHTSLLEDLTQVITPDKEGNISYEYQIDEAGMQAKATVALNAIFEENQIGMSKNRQIMHGDESGDLSYIETYTRNEDGTVTLKVYKYNNK